MDTQGLLVSALADSEAASQYAARYGYTNQALQQMLGYTAEEFRAMPPGGPSKSDDWQGSESRWRKLMQGEISSYDVARSFRHAD